MSALKPIDVTERLYRRARRATRRAPREGSHQPPMWVVFDRAVNAALDKTIAVVDVVIGSDPVPMIEIELLFRSPELVAAYREQTARIERELAQALGVPKVMLGG